MQEPVILKIKSALLPDVFTMAKYRISPYIGCAHACTYCDGRAEKYFVQGEFSEARTKSAFAQGNPYEFSGVREKGFISFGSGITDIYQPCESVGKQVPRLIQAAQKSKNPVMFITKGALMLRDLELWKPIAQGPGLLVYITITSVDQDIADIVEPNAASIHQRFEGVKAFTSIGADVGVLALPLLPGISDTTEVFSALAQRAKDNGTSFCMPGSVTLRPGRQKEHFFSVLQRHFPHLIAQYQHIYREDRISGMPSQEYRETVASQWTRSADALGIPTACPHQGFRGKLSLCDEVFVVLCRMEEAYRCRGVNTYRLKKGLETYAKYLCEKKAVFNRRKNLPHDWMDIQLRFDLQTGILERILDNVKITDFIAQLCNGDKFFDFSTLKFID